MQGNPEIVELLNEVLTAELTAINQYFLHAKIMEDWGYLRLAEHTKHESIDEMKHAEIVTDRVLFLDGLPNYQRYFPLRIGETVPEMFQADLELEYTAVERLNRAITNAVNQGKNEVLIMRFPADWCTDKGRAINNFEPDWPKTLTGFAERAVQVFEKELAPLGYKAKAQVLSYPGGMLGEIGIFISW